MPSNYIKYFNDCTFWQNLLKILPNLTEIEYFRYHAVVLHLPDFIRKTAVSKYDFK